MPKSKRDKKISLTNTRKKGLELKQNLVEEIRQDVDRYARIFIFSVQNMRNGKLKDIRTEWKHSRFLFGKNKVMALALGRTAEEEYKDHLHLLSDKLKGQCGLLFTNHSKEEVQKWFAEYSEADFARSGNMATDTVSLDKGPLSQFSHSMEPQLRQLGLPTSLQRGIVHLIKDHSVCNEGDILTPEQARILKLLGNQMAEFKITLECVWNNDGTFEELNEKKTKAEKTKKKNKSKKNKKMKTNEDAKQERPKKVSKPDKEVEEASEDEGDLEADIDSSEEES